MILENEDVLILTENDLCFLNKKVCCGTTLKGKSCKNKTFEKYNYCKLHYNKFRLCKEENCPVCMESLDNVKVPLSCSHWIHKSCILKWGKDECPICRSKIKLTSVERRKLRNKTNNNLENNEFTNDEDIILPPHLLEVLNNIVRSFPESMRSEFIIGVNFDDNSISISNDNFSEEELNFINEE
jgi:hypothetical protein